MLQAGFIVNGCHSELVHGPPLPFFQSKVNCYIFSVFKWARECVAHLHIWWEKLLGSNVKSKGMIFALLRIQFGAKGRAHQ